MVRTVGVVTYDETRLKLVSARVDGWIDQLYVNFSGQSVRKGEPLFALYSPMLVAAQQELLLAQQLRGDVAAGTADAIGNSADLVESARRRLLDREVSLEEIRQLEASGEVRKTITFRSPASGVVIEKFVTAGQRVMAGETVYQIADLSTVWLDGEIFERDLPSVRLGREVVAWFPALPGDPRTGRISYVYPTINGETRTARVRVTLQISRSRSEAGDVLHFQLRRGNRAVVECPRSAVLSTGERNLVFVRLPNGMLAPRDVRLGIETDERIEILSGVAIGDTVVASATFLVDAESTSGSLLGGMGGMPGMDMTAPTALPVPKPSATPQRGGAAPRGARDTMKSITPQADHAGHPMPDTD